MNDFPWVILPVTKELFAHKEKFVHEVFKRFLALPWIGNYATDFSHYAGPPCCLPKLHPMAS